MKIARAGFSAVLLAAILFGQASAARNSCESLASLALPDTTITLAQTVTAGKVERTRPLCPYPLVAVYNGRGNSDDAANFSCKP